jgi:carbamoyltransferase
MDSHQNSYTLYPTGYGKIGGAIVKILGVHDGINASACLLEDGRIKHCIQEERLTNIKNYIGFPTRSVQKILELEHIAGTEIDYVAIASFATFASADPADNLLSSYRKKASVIRSSLIDFGIKTPFYSMYRTLRQKDRLKNLTSLNIPADRATFIDHHLCHAATAYYGCPWKDEDVLVLTSDGSGDGLCATVYTGRSGTLTKVAKTEAGSSIGDIYSRITFMLGLIPHEHEWKIMGLAPYAPEKGVQKSYQYIKNYLAVPDGGLTYHRLIPESTNAVYRRMRRDLEFQRFDWIAGGVQLFTEEMLCRWIQNAINKTGIKKIALAGGVFMNVKANKRIMEIAEVTDIFVFPSCGDESTSIGAAYQRYAELCREGGREVTIPPLRDIYFGPAFTDSEIQAVLSGCQDRFSVAHSSDIQRDVSDLIAGGEVVARFAGRMEFGARALGNRSILADPSNQACVRTINMMVKKRDFWMPFAPVIRAEQQHDFIINKKRVLSPYMMLSFDTTPRRNEFIASVHPADYTARAQILDESYNPDFHRLIREFEKRTQRGVLLNTSLNLHGYPVVCDPSAALRVFENSGLQYLALGNYLVSKQGTAGKAG